MTKKKGYSRRKGDRVRVKATRKEGVITVLEKGTYWVKLDGARKERPYAPAELESVRNRQPALELGTNVAHEFQMSAVQEYCKVCTLPRGNAIHTHVIEKTTEEVLREKYPEKRK